MYRAFSFIFFAFALLGCSQTTNPNVSQSDIAQIKDYNDANGNRYVTTISSPKNALWVEVSVMDPKLIGNMEAARASQESFSKIAYEIIDPFCKARGGTMDTYRGSGNPVFYGTAFTWKFFGSCK